MTKNNSRFVLEDKKNDFYYHKNRSSLNITFNRVAFIFFIFLTISIIFSIHLTHLGTRKDNNEISNNYDLNDEELTEILCKNNNQEECKCEEFRPKCPVHFNNLKNKDDFRDTDYLDIIGHLGKIEIDNDHAELEIMPIKEQDLLIVKKMSLSKLPSAELLKEGVLIGLFNMRLDNFNGFFDELPNSRGYIYSDE